MGFKLKEKIKKTLLNLSFLDNRDLHAKKAVIWDKICPKCRNFIYGNNGFCICGYSAAREKAVKLWGIVAFTWLFIFISIFFIFNSFSQLSSIVYQKIESSDSNFYSLSPAGVQIVTSLKNSKYRDYIQTIYIHPKEKNRLMVLIKPFYWEMLSSEEKELLKQIILKKWDKIYRNTTPNSKSKPVVDLANFE